jgi:hypothetical protein
LPVQVCPTDAIHEINFPLKKLVSKEQVSETEEAVITKPNRITNENNSNQE